MSKQSKVIKRSTIAAIIVSLFISLGVAMPSQAAVPSLEQIRVALYVNLPGKYTSLTKGVTLSSAEKMNLSVQADGKIVQWLTFAENDQLRLAVNDFKVKLYEGKDFATAKKAYDAIAAAGGSPFIISLNKNNSVTYQVIEGGYATSNEATTALNKWKNNATITKLTGSAMQLTGPFSLMNGGHASKADALKAAASFGAQGIDTALGLSLNKDGKLEYSVLVGLTATQAELELVKTKATKVSNKLENISGNANLLTMRVDHSATANATSSDELYLYNPHLLVKVKAANSGNLKLNERSARSYRGTIEAGVLNNYMYVVNELPFEQYLYSVVAIEMYPSWPMEALKAQAVAARTYALYGGNSFTVAHVVDTTTSQAYYGVNSEHPNSTAAVDATKGEVLLYNGKLVETLFSANAGGRTADAKEIWGNEVAYLKSVTSPDSIAENGLHSWYRVVLPNGKVGYIRDDLVTDTGKKNEAGKPILLSTTDGTNIRRNPQIQSNVSPIAQINKNVELVALEKIIESNSMNWRRGPYSGEEMLKTISSKLSITGPITTIEVTEKGVSGRAIAVSVNGQKLGVANPATLRSVLGVEGSLNSTYFTIEQTGQVVVLGASGQRTKSDGAGNLQVLGSGGRTAKATEEYMFVLDGKGNVRAATKEAGFQFDGKGNGHGVGMSQYGAYSLAQQGNDYKYILQYYYAGTTIAKDE